jgi:hypothetical protein
MLLPNNLHQQLMQQSGIDPLQVLGQPKTETSRSRTPSPPCTLEEAHLQPPLLRFAPPYTGAAVSSSDVMQRRRRPKGRGLGAWDSARDDVAIAGSWESGSMEWETGSTASSSSHRGRRSGASYIATNLSYLECKDSACIIAVKKITKLGFDAAESLRLHFEQFGHVEEVLLSNVPVNGEHLQEHANAMRRRPPGMGWVVMKNAEDAERALSHGELQTVQAAQIRAAPFIKKLQNQTSEAIAEESAEEDKEDLADIENPYKGRWCDA